MSGRPSAATEKALRLVSKGLTPYAAAKKVGIALSTIYRAVKKQRNKNWYTKGQTCTGKK